MICDFPRRLSVNLLQNAINHFKTFHVPNSEIWWRADISWIILDDVSLSFTFRRLSHSCTLLKPLDRMRFHLAQTLT